MKEAMTYINIMVDDHMISYCVSWEVHAQEDMDEKENDDDNDNKEQKRKNKKKKRRRRSKRRRS
jgi:hypothetical protein